MRRAITALILSAGCARPEGDLYWSCVEFYEDAAECANCSDVISEPECSDDQFAASMEFCESLNLAPCGRRDHDAGACENAKEQVKRFRGLDEDLAGAIEDCE